MWLGKIKPLVTVCGNIYVYVYNICLFSSVCTVTKDGQSDTEKIELSSIVSRQNYSVPTFKPVTEDT